MKNAAKYAILISRYQTPAANTIKTRDPFVFDKVENSTGGI